MLYNILNYLYSLLNVRIFAVSNIKRYKVMKAIRIYSYYSFSHRSWVHIKEFTKHDALLKARMYDPYVLFSVLSLLIQNGR